MYQVKTTFFPTKENPLQSIIIDFSRKYENKSSAYSMKRAEEKRAAKEERRGNYMVKVEIVKA
jgi:hypothetical protein